MIKKILTNRIFGGLTFLLCIVGMLIGITFELHQIVIIVLAIFSLCGFLILLGPAVGEDK